MRRQIVVTAVVALAVGVGADEAFHRLRRSNSDEFQPMAYCSHEGSADQCFKTRQECATWVAKVEGRSCRGIRTAWTYQARSGTSVRERFFSSREDCEDSIDASVTWDLLGTEPTTRTDCIRVP
jgi:hypothetical protein